MRLTRQMWRSLRRAVPAVAALVLLVSAPVVAGPPICPISDSDLEKAVRTFNQMAAVFQDKRCSNCHGAVNPFSDTGGHAGGKFSFNAQFQGLLGNRAELVADLTRVQGHAPSDQEVANAVAAMKTYLSAEPPMTDREAIRDVLELGGIKDLVEAQCAACHKNQPAPWGLASSLWAGKSPEQLCEFIQATMDPSDFLNHVTEDRLGFVQTGFAGTRGLTPAGQAILKEQTGRDYVPEPVKAMSASAFTTAANDWIDALGGRFHKPPSCGCSVQKYRLNVKGETDIHVQGGAGSSKSKLDRTMDMAFGKDGTFSGPALTTPVTISNKMNAGGTACTLDMILDQTLKINGRVDEAAGRMSVTTTVSGQSRPAQMTCTVPGRVIRSPVPATTSDPQTRTFEMPAQVDEPGQFEVSFGPNGSVSLELRVVPR
jgi:mono/diheme cytochrome c family protein